jgi:hypothetical protein
MDVGVAVLKVLSFCLLWYSSLVYVSNPKFVPVEDYGIFMPPELCEQKNWMTKGKYKRKTCGGDSPCCLFAWAQKCTKMDQ